MFGGSFFGGAFFGGGVGRHYQRYVARFKGREHEFNTEEELEDFVREALLQEDRKPVRKQQPIKIQLAVVQEDEPLRFESIRFKPSDIKVENLLAKIWRNDDDEDDILWLI